MASFVQDFTPPNFHSPFRETDISQKAARLVKICLNSPNSADVLRLPSDLPQTPINECGVCGESEEIADSLKLIAPPSNFGATAISRQLVLKYRDYLTLSKPNTTPDFSTFIAKNQNLASATCNQPERSQIINLGLSCLTSVLAELDEKEPQICSNALNSLKYLLQALRPEELCKENTKLIQKLFRTLLKLRLSSSEEVSTGASSCILSLAIANGLPQFLLEAAFSFLTASLTGSEHEHHLHGSIPVPENYRQLFFHQITVNYLHEKSTGSTKKYIPSWFSSTIPESRTLATFSVEPPPTLSPEDEHLSLVGSVASDGSYVYILTTTGLYKMGTGFSETISGKEYGTNPVLKASPDSWLSVCNGSLYLRRKHSTRLWVLDSDSLREIGEILLPAATVQGNLCSDGNDFHLLWIDAGGNLTINSVTDNFAPTSDPAFRLKLTQTKHVWFGDDIGEIFTNLQPTLSEETIDIQVSRHLSLLLTNSGKVYHCTQNKDAKSPEHLSWTELSFQDSVVQISLSPDGSHTLIRTSAGHVWYAGSGLQCELQGAPQVALREKAALTRPRRVIVHNQRKIVHCAASATILGLVTENGRVYVYGRHTNHSHPETNQVMGLENIHMAYLALGKTHAVALTRHGNVYTWGLNNLYQCGRVESLKAPYERDAAEAAPSPMEQPSTFHLCAPAEHLWVKDVATICTACGMCSAHGIKCPSRSGSPVRGSFSSCGPGESGCLRCGVCRRCGEHGSPNSTRETDKDSENSSERSRRLVLNPEKLPLPGPQDLKITRVACGNYHTLLLSTEGQVYTFGSNCHGQLGVGDTRRRQAPQLIAPSVPNARELAKIVQVAAGSNHSVLKTNEGLVFTFGSNRHGQLCREGAGKHWQSRPGLVQEMGGKIGVLAVWIGAFGDSTVIRCEQRMLRNPTLESVSATANNAYFILFENMSNDKKLSYVVINRKTGQFRHFTAELPPVEGNLGLSWTLDPHYDTLWSYNAGSRTVASITYWDLPVKPVQEPDSAFAYADFLLSSPEYWVPCSSPDIPVAPFQMGLCLLATIYSLSTSILTSKLSRSEAGTPSEQDGTRRVGESYSTVARFQNYGGGWGYSAQSIEAIQFQTNLDIQLIGFGLFGGRGEYLARIKLLRLVGQDHDEHNLELLSESEEILYECPPRDKAHLFFSRNIHCQAGQTYIAWVQINGPSSDCGAGGQTNVTGEDGVVFQFRNSRLSNNGTDIHVGQLPLLLYKVDEVRGQREVLADTQLVLPLPSFTTLLIVTPQLFQVLFSLLSWTVDCLFDQERTESNEDHSSESMEWKECRIVTVGVMGVRLLRFYLGLSSPTSVEESGLGDQTLKFLRNLFSKGHDLTYPSHLSLLFEEAVKLHVDCFDLLFPKAESIQETLFHLMKEKASPDWSLVALIESLAAKDCILPVLVLTDSLLQEDPKAKRTRTTGFVSLLRFLVELTFRQPPAEIAETFLSKRLKSAASRLLVEMGKDLVTSSDENPPLPVISTPSRFSRISSQTLWDSSAGTPDAVAFKVDGYGLSLHGICVFVGSGGGFSYNVDVLVNQGDGFQESWHVLEKVNGSISTADYGSGEKGIVRLHKPVKLTPHSLYAVRLYLQGGKTWSGEGGEPSVRLVNGTTVSFQVCSLSLNGTNISRGQIPSLLYSVGPSKNHLRAMRLLTANREQTIKWFILLMRTVSGQLLDSITSGTFPCETEIISKLFGWASIFLSLHHGRALDIFGAVDELIPVVAATNSQRKDNTPSPSSCSQRQVVVESEHPYKPANVSSSIVRFDMEVQYLCLEFSEQCSTAQPEDTLSVYWSNEREEKFYPVGKYGGLRTWPTHVVMIPGNCLWFVLETASTYNRVEAEKMYGYRCLISSFSLGPCDPLIFLERELTWLASLACRYFVVEPDLSSDENALLEEEVQEMIQGHGSLLRKGLSLSHAPSVQEIVHGSIPRRAVSSEMKFLNEFISASCHTAAGRLAHWFMQEAFVDLDACELRLEPEELKSGESASVSLVLKDQFDRTATSPQMKVEVVVRFGHSSESSPTSGGVVLPSLSTLQTDAYQPTYLNKARYTSVTMMPSYQEFSFEELRLAYFRDAVLRESVQMVQSESGSFSGRWTPRQSGTYVIEGRVDGFRLPQSYRVDVEDGISSNGRSERRKVKLSRARLATVNERLMTRGVRIRVGPSTCAQLIGLIPRGATVTYIEELENRDGLWLRLTDEASLLYSDSPHFPNQSWCLHFNAAIQKNLFIRDNEEEDYPAGAQFQSIIVASEETYVVMKGEEGERGKLGIHQTPSLNDVPFAFVSINDVIHSDGWLQNREGVWTRVNALSLKRFCKNKQEGFCLAQDLSGTIFLERMQQTGNKSVEGNLDNGNISPMRPLDFSGEFAALCGKKEPSKSKPTAHVWPRPSSSSSKSRPIQAISPSIADCARSAFAALLWHESLVHDAIASAAYLKFHPELSGLLLKQTDLANFNVPASLQLLARLWQDVSAAILTSVQQHLILPSPPMAMRGFPEDDKDCVKKDGGEQLCELCHEWFPSPVATHMRLSHPGCGSHAGGQGYNSMGRYTSGWTGNCGDGGRGVATWYLLCSACRYRYHMAGPNARLLEKNRRARMLRLSVGAAEPQLVIKQNAMFLLELNGDIENEKSKDSSQGGSGWAINLFPDTQSTTHSMASGLSIGVISGSKTTSHASDPGPKPSQLTPFNSSIPIPCSEPASRYDERAEVKESRMFLASPSVALKTLVVSNTQSRGISTTLKWPVLAFVIQNHDLTRVRETMRISIRRSATLAHAFRIWNWLLRLVSAEYSVMDILWNFLTALNSYSSRDRSWKTKDGDFSRQLLRHPLHLCILAGSLSHRMLRNFHTFLYTITLILRSENVDPSLRRLCFRAWMFQLTPHEQELILGCHLLSCVGRVMSDPEYQSSWQETRSLEVEFAGADLEELADLTSMIVLETSSRPAMAVCLTDGTTETFWESGEEDKNRSKSICLTLPSDSVHPLLLSVHIDNQKDEGHRVSHITFFSLIQNKRRLKLLTRTLDAQFSGWIHCWVHGQQRFVVEVKGTDQSLRVRLVNVSGKSKKRNHPSFLKTSPSLLLQFSAAQSDAFSVFQSIAAQAFTGEFAEGTLRQQVFDMLFSRTQLQSLQGYVCAQVVFALEREVDLLRTKAKRNYSYCCGLLGMLIRISCSPSAKDLFGPRNNLLPILSELLLFSSPLVQCQTIDTIEKLMGTFEPDGTDSKTFILNLFAVLAKVITLQVREKVQHTVSTLTLHTAVEEPPPGWRVDQQCSSEIGKVVAALIVDIAKERFGKWWAASARYHIAEYVLYVGNVGEEDVMSSACLHSQKFWLGLAALATFRDETWLEYCSQSKITKASSSSILLCENHDDGKTEAQLYCESCCTSLCRGCHSVLHLSKRNRTHIVKTIGPTENHPQVHVHEACARVRLPWLLVLLDGATLNGMVEIAAPDRPHIAEILDNNVKGCRFCQNPTGSELVDVCAHSDCQTLVSTACNKILHCGHLCGGVVNETTCLPCLQCKDDSSLRQDADDVCVICFTDRLGGAPSIHLGCGHVFHYQCCKATLYRRWSGPRISFGFMKCPLCQQLVEHPSLEEFLAPLNAIYKDVMHKVKLRLEYDNLMDSPAITQPGGPFYNDPEAYAMERYLYVLCHKCGKAYFGGEAHCQEVLGSSQYDPEELLCGGCSDVSGAEICARHGIEFLEYKCRYCCSVAVFFCFGTTHFCTGCHDDFQRLVTIPKQKLSQCPVAPRGVQLEEGPCPLKIRHPATGEEFALGCGICRNLSTF